MLNCFYRIDPRGRPDYFHIHFMNFVRITNTRSCVYICGCRRSCRGSSLATTAYPWHTEGIGTRTTIFLHRWWLCSMSAQLLSSCLFVWTTVQMRAADHSMQILVVQLGQCGMVDHLLGLDDRANKCFANWTGIVLVGDAGSERGESSRIGKCGHQDFMRFQCCLWPMEQD